jgi:hypothetical protein
MRAKKACSREAATTTKVMKPKVGRGKGKRHIESKDCAGGGLATADYRE